MHDRRTSSQRGAIDQRLLLGGGAVLVLGALVFAVRGRRPPPPRRPVAGAVAPRAPATPPPPPPDVPPPPPVLVENDFHPADPGMPSFAEHPRQPVRPAADVPPVIPASSGDYGIDVASQIRPALPGMQRCIAALNPAHPRAADVWVTISTRGRVSAAHLATDAGAGTDACLLAALQVVAFASPGSTSQTFGIPVPAQ